MLQCPPTWLAGHSEDPAVLALVLTLSAAIGFTLGVFGGGGSVFAVPVLVFAAHLAPAQAVALSLAMVGATSLVAAYSHWRSGHVQPQVALSFGGAGVATAFVGAKLSHLVSPRVLMFLFAALMLGVGGWMLAQRKCLKQGPASPGTPTRFGYALLVGGAVGLLTGFLGVGGGFLVVPALMTFVGLKVRDAVGTSLLVIALNSAAGFVGHLGDASFDTSFVVLLTAASILGGAAGARFGCRLPIVKLQRGFAICVIATGVVVAIASGLGTSRSLHNASRSLVQSEMGSQPH